MMRSRFTEAQIIGMIKEQEAGMGDFVAHTLASENERLVARAAVWQI
jgi:hypothetical protein